MPSGSGARASASSSAAERSSYRTTLIDSCGSGGSALDALPEDVALRVLRGAHLLVEVVEVVERRLDDVRPEQLADLVAVQRVDRFLLLHQLRDRRRELRGQFAGGEEL